MPQLGVAESIKGDGRGHYLSYLVHLHMAKECRRGVTLSANIGGQNEMLRKGKFPLDASSKASNMSVYVW